eukprot:scaffold2162_cov398-Prasinococcus_capsulatus_cf.AAC.22
MNSLGGRHCGPRAQRAGFGDVTVVSDATTAVAVTTKESSGCRQHPCRQQWELYAQVARRLDRVPHILNRSARAKRRPNVCVTVLGNSRVAL